MVNPQTFFGSFIEIPKLTYDMKPQNHYRGSWIDLLCWAGLLSLSPYIGIADCWHQSPLRLQRGILFYSTSFSSAQKFGLGIPELLETLFSPIQLLTNILVVEPHQTWALSTTFCRTSSCQRQLESPTSHNETQQPFSGSNGFLKCHPSKLGLGHF